MAEELVRWGLIGASTITREWMLDAIRANPACRVEAVASRSLDRARRFADENGIARAYGKVEDLLRDPQIDAVYIGTTNERHAPQAIAAARAGKHVLCEKPLAIEIAEAEAMVYACREAGVVLGTNHHLRNMDAHRTIKRLIDSGVVGTITSVRIFHAGQIPPHLATWRLHDTTTGPGAILDLTVHDADLLRFYLERNPIRVTAFAHSCGDTAAGIEDNVMSIWEFPGNILAQCHDSFVCGTAPRGVEVHGTKGSILGADVLSQRPVGTVTLRTAEGDRMLQLDAGNAYERVIDDFVSAIRGGGQPTASGEDGLWSLRIAKAVAEAAMAGEVVDLM